MIAAAAITGLVLAGGAGARMGGLDKGLVPYHGTALARHAALRLVPQVGPVMISANRNEARYAGFGFTVLADGTPGSAMPQAQGGPPDFTGPLAGMLAGLRRCNTPWLAVVPCDAPLFPLDLVARLAHGASIAGARAAVAVTRPTGDEPGLQPAFCLLHRALEADLADALGHGERKAGRWLATMAAAQVTFDDPGAFANANTLAELEQIAAHG